MEDIQRSTDIPSFGFQRKKQKYKSSSSVYLKYRLIANNYTALDASYAKYETDHRCVYIYGDFESSKRLRRIETSVDIFECSNKRTVDEQLECIGNTVEFHST